MMHAFRLCVALLFASQAHGCTNILVSKSASADGSVILSYNADSGELYGTLGHYPAKTHPPGSTREIWDWDGQFYLGTIPEANQTYNVVGNSNEHGLVIGETTFGGRPELDGHGSGAIMDYGSLIWVTLQRTRTAREAIKMMDHLAQTYGYASDGESFSVADGKEVWLMELIGKGKEKGAVWVAMRVPEGYIGSTANQARITTFPLNDPDNALYAKDVVSFAKRKKLYPQDAPDGKFSFSDTYDPVTFFGARAGEARVWNIFQAASGGKFDQYLEYAKGYNLTKRMPLFCPVAHKLTVNDTMQLMRTHFEDTWFDNRGLVRADLGAGPGNSAYRWRPLMWESDGKKYVNERTVGVQQTAWAFVAQVRSWMPRQMRALFWFAPDDSATAVRIPVYGGATAIPAAYGGRVGQLPGAGVSYAPDADATKMSLDSAFWVYNLVANMAYGERYAEVMPLVQERIHHFQGQMFAAVAAADKHAAALFKNDTAAAVEYITQFSVQTGQQMLKDWRDFWMQLFVTFRDGYTFGPPAKPQCQGGVTSDCTATRMPSSTESGYSREWYRRIVADSDNAQHYAVPPQHLATSEQRRANQHKLKRMQKQR